MILSTSKTSVTGVMTRRGLTLTELLIATSLLGVLALASTNMEVGARTFFLKDYRRSALITEGMTAIEHVMQRVRNGQYTTRPPVGLSPNGDPSTVGLFVDNANGDADDATNRTPADCADDRFVTYLFENNQLTYSANGANEILARDVDTANSAFSFSGGPNAGGGPTVTLRLVLSRGGETVTLQSSATTRFSQCP